MREINQDDIQYKEGTLVLRTSLDSMILYKVISSDRYEKNTNRIIYTIEVLYEKLDFPYKGNQLECPRIDRIDDLTWFSNSDVKEYILENKLELVEVLL